MRKDELQKRVEELEEELQKVKGLVLVMVAGCPTHASSGKLFKVEGSFTGIVCTVSLR